MRNIKLFKSKLRKRLEGIHSKEVLAPIFPSPNAESFIIGKLEVPCVYRHTKHLKHYNQALEVLKVFLYCTDCGKRINEKIDYVILRTNYVCIFSKLSNNGEYYVAVLRLNDSTYCLFRHDATEEIDVAEDVGSFPVLNISVESNVKEKKNKISETIKGFFERICSIFQKSV